MVSHGCSQCYAEKFENRFRHVVWGKHGTRVLTSEANWKKPLKWDGEAQKNGQRFRVFCASLCDIFEDWQGEIKNHHGDTMMICPNGHIDGSVWEQTPQYIECSHECGAYMRPMTMREVRRRLFRLIDQTPELTWVLLTKRPENIADMWWSNVAAEGLSMKRDNVILGTSIENQETANERVPHLLRCKPLASKLFLSAEPLLGPIDLPRAHLVKEKLPGWPEPCRVDWVIAGCESGPQRRPMQLDWCESMLNACKEKGVAFFMKQMEVDGKIATDVTKFPESLRVQEFPK